MASVRTKGRKPVTKSTPKKDWRDVFITKLAEAPDVSGAAQAAGVDRRYVYRERDKNPEFLRRWDDALEQSLDRAEKEMYRRAVDGTEEPIYYQGDKVGSIRRFSDTLLIFMLKSRRRAIYGERITNFNIDFSQLSMEQLERIANGEDPALVASSGTSGDREEAAA
jgi:hypothetical protein